MEASLAGVPVDGARDATDAEVVKGMALRRVTLSEVVGEAPDMARVPGNKGFEAAIAAIEMVSINRKLAGKETPQAVVKI